MDPLTNITASAPVSHDAASCCHWNTWHVLLGSIFTLTSIVLGTALRPSQFPTVKGPKSLFLLGNLLDLLRFGPLKCITTWGKEFGDVFKFRIGLRETLVVGDVNLVKDISVKKFKAFRNRFGPAQLPKEAQNGIVLGRDKYWSTARGASLPWFHNKEHLESYLAVMNEVARKMVDHMSKVPKEDTFQLLNHMQELTLDVFCCAAFGSTLDDSVDTKAAEIARNVSQTTTLVSSPSMSGVIAFFVPPFVARAIHCVFSFIPGTREWTNRTTSTERQRVGLQLLKQRLREEEAGGKRQDVLTQLLRAQAKAKESDVKLSHKELMYVLGELIVAGSDTTANTISLAVFLLCTHPEQERRFLKEIDSLSADCPPISVENIEQYKFVNMVVKETLRLYPIGSQLFREAMEDTSIGQIPVPKGSRIMFHLWLLHRNPQNFPNPNGFVPERFDSEDALSQGNNMNAFLPFGEGPRMCLGAKFAVLEAALVLINLYRRFTFKLSGEFSELKGSEAIEKFPVSTGVILKPKEGVPLNILPRKDTQPL